MKKNLVSLFVTLFAALTAANASELRVEPPCWWSGMKCSLQLMIHGENLKGAEVSVKGDMLKIAAVHEAESPNYLFVDIVIPDDVKSGEFTFVVKRQKGKALKFNYNIYERRENSASRQGFGSSDVVYLLMPDRFANGNPENDSTDDTAEKADRTTHGGRHGGDLKGISDHLDYIADLGATVVWPTPVLLDDEPQSSYHGYACADYYKVDPRMGSNEEYRQLVSDAHAKGLKFIQDLVPNHCGTAHWWMKDLPFADWINQFDTFTRSNFALSTHSDPYASKIDKELNVTGWFDTSMPDMNLRNPYLLQYFTQWAIWWVEYADLDGLRVDTFPYSDKYKIAHWTRSIMNEYPNLTIVGECWMNTPSEIAYWEGIRPNADGYSSELNMVMDFYLQSNIISALNNNEKEPAWGEGIRKVYNSLSMDFVYDNPYNLLVFMANHDTPRPALLLEGNLGRLKNATTLLLTLRGVPQLYVGDELMFQSADGTIGHVQERIDFPGGWQGDEVNMFTSEGRTGDRAELYEHTRTLLNWRKSDDAVRFGKFLHFLPESNCYAYFRYTDDDLVMVVVNNSTEDYAINWNTYDEVFNGASRTGVEVLGGEEITVGDEVVVPGMSSMVIDF